jgi:uncharacterized protein YndB with AHSA1/START domain
MTMPVDDLRLTKIPAVNVGMLIRRPPAEVFQAFADPAVTTKFWFTKSSGKMTQGANLQWDWEMFGVSTKVAVKEVENNKRILFEWNDDKPLTVELRFIPSAGGATFVQVTETGLSGTGDEIVSHIAGSTAGFTKVLCALKALLEHDVALAVVADHLPEGPGT